MSGKVGEHYEKMFTDFPDIFGGPKTPNRGPCYGLWPQLIDLYEGQALVQTLSLTYIKFHVKNVTNSVLSIHVSSTTSERCRHLLCPANALVQSPFISSELQLLWASPPRQRRGLCHDMIPEGP